MVGLFKFFNPEIRVQPHDLVLRKLGQLHALPPCQLEQFYRSLGLPVRLHEANIADDRLQEMADNAMIGTPAVGMTFQLHADDILQILTLAK